MSGRLPIGLIELRVAPQTTAAAGVGLASFAPAAGLQPLRMSALREGDASLPAGQLGVLRPPVRQHTKLWEFSSNLHCSIIGTCLSTAELRQVLLKIGVREAATAGEHDVHASAVLIAGKHQGGARLLHKALDRRHRVAISRFDKAKSTAEVQALWREFVQAGDIPGAYWAALTHMATNDALVREIFTEVHMLSHLVGAANRADIRRLRQLEAENAALHEKVARQQGQLRDAIVARDATIRELSQALEARIAQTRDNTSETGAATDAGWEALASDLKARLTRSEARRVTVESQLIEARASLASERDVRTAAERNESALRDELEALETSIADAGDAARQTEPDVRLRGLTLLYVGGRPAQVAHIRAAAERDGAALLHHDGGIEERGGLLPGLVSRADAVLFPVDCISHAAVAVLKRLCRQMEKPFLPLRSAGLAPFRAALKDAAFGGAVA